MSWICYIFVTFIKFRDGTRKNIFSIGKSDVSKFQHDSTKQVLIRSRPVVTFPRHCLQ